MQCRRFGGCKGCSSSSFIAWYLVSLDVEHVTMQEVDQTAKVVLYLMKEHDCNLMGEVNVKKN